MSARNPRLRNNKVVGLSASHLKSRLSDAELDSLFANPRNEADIFIVYRKPSVCPRQILPLPDQLQQVEWLGFALDVAVPDPANLDASFL